MNISPINNNQKKEVSFEKLKKISCSNDFCTTVEKRVKIELQNMATNHDFFKANDVDAFIHVGRNIATLKLKYKPITNNLIDKIKNLFMDKKELTLANYHHCPDEGMFFLVKDMRSAKTSEDLFNLAIINK